MKKRSIKLQIPTKLTVDLVASVRRVREAAASRRAPGEIRGWRPRVKHQVECQVVFEGLKESSRAHPGESE